ncbi:nuclear transport factor 2 family protein [Nitrosopumilus sp. b1]|uniref:nuclear transport factor 2 family protein n=1 Tax=Nitrosopumilus sp. b1 TaxID=2109907 RepID=UPI0015F58363|nr:nuclear transport factor 2 family protein [Nitrosopumilus sp. b1]
MDSKDHVQNWINAWNKHDLQTILKMYSENIDFESPKIRDIIPELSVQKITDKKTLEKYWKKGLEKYPNLHFTYLTHFQPDDKTCILQYLANLDGTSTVSVMEQFTFENDIIIKSQVFYGVKLNFDYRFESHGVFVFRSNGTSQDFSLGRVCEDSPL